MRQVLLAVLVLCLLATVVSAEEIYPGYAWSEVGEEIYLHSRVDTFAGPIDGNSVVIVNDEDVFVVDTHINPAAARAVIGKIRELTDKPVTLVVNTHWHDDHVNGNHAYRLAFPDSKIISHHDTLAALKVEWQKAEDERRAAFESVKGVDIYEAADQLEATDPEKAMGYRLFAGYRDALEPEMATLELIYPDITFDDELVFERGDRTIVIQWVGKGNTNGDAVVWLPKEKVLITGDMLVAPIPYAFDSPMVEWVETLGKLEAFGAETIIPGHAGVQQDNEYIGQVISLLRATLTTVEKANSEGVAYEDLATSVDLSEHEQRFAGDDPARAYAWRSFYLDPGVKSAWASLGYPVPESD